MDREAPDLIELTTVESPTDLGTNDLVLVEPIEHPVLIVVERLVDLADPPSGRSSVAVHHDQPSVGHLE
jgi:hypothetical protein